MMALEYVQFPWAYIYNIKLRSPLNLRHLYIYISR